jgi:AraC-like DNA-binding protein/mannose-6-phosphate isomerase-like protein (cupin superfamily)
MIESSREVRAMLSINPNEYVDDFTNNHLYELPFYIKYRWTDAHFQMNFHSHHGYELFFMHEGTGNYVNDGYIYPFQGNDLILIEPHQIHKSSPEAGKRFTRTVINFLPGFLNPDSKKLVMDLFSKEYKAERRHIVICPEKHGHIYKLLEQMHAEYVSRCTGFEQVLGILLNRLLQHVHRMFFVDSPSVQGPANPANSIAEDVIQYLTHHYSDNIPLEDLAKMFYVTPYYLCRLFKKATGDTIGRFVLYTRIHHAKRELAFTDRSILDIATQVGFNSYSYFGLVFKQHEGLTPKQYRNKYKQSAAAPFPSPDKR